MSWETEECSHQTFKQCSHSLYAQSEQASGQNLPWLVNAKLLNVEEAGLNGCRTHSQHWCGKRSWCSELCYMAFCSDHLRVDHTSRLLLTRSARDRVLQGSWLCETVMQIQLLEYLVGEDHQTTEDPKQKMFCKNSEKKIGFMFTARNKARLLSSVWRNFLLKLWRQHCS